MTPTEGVPVVRVVCDLCDGTGTITIVEDYDFEGKSIYAPDECPECEGRLYVERTLYVDAAHPAAASAESIRAEVIEECAKWHDDEAARLRERAREVENIGAKIDLSDEARRHSTHATSIRALASARATKEV